MASETHGYLVNGWKYMKDNLHVKGKLLENNSGGVCMYGGLLVGNGITTQECRDFYPPFTGNLEKFNGAAKLLQKFTPEGGNVPAFNDLDWVPKEYVVAIFELAIKHLEQLEGIPAYRSAIIDHVNQEPSPGSKEEDWLPKEHGEVVEVIPNFGAMINGPTNPQIPPATESN
jgi:hypothetical protein